MENSIFHRLSTLLWGVIVTLTVLFAVYVSLGRLLASNLGLYQEQILAELNSRVPFRITAERVDGEWHSFNPAIILSGLRLTVPGMEQGVQELSKGRIALDLLESLRTWSLQSTRLELDGLHLSGEVDAGGRFRLTGFGDGGGELQEWLREFLLHIERMALRNNTLHLKFPSGESRMLDLQLELSREGSRRYLDARLDSMRGTRIHALGRGLGNPLRPDAFTGELYLQIGAADLAAVGSLAAEGAPPIWSDGALDLELWLNWDRGELDVESRAVAHDLRLFPRDRSWEIPLERLALEAKLVERKNRRTLFASGVQLQNAGVSAVLPRVQLDLWGESLRVRSGAVDLGPANRLLGTLGLLPDRLSDVFATLQPEGRLDALQVNITDVGTPAAEWELEANFSSVDVQSWKGAPGVTAASGHVTLANGTGFVVLDSRDLTLVFPTVYENPLAYSDIYGTIGIAWDERALRLASGLIEARAEEGTVRALFGLNVPIELSTAGLEMDLLAGLAGSEARHRAKYIPYILSPALRDWLSASVGQGRVEQAGFIWRGSLAADAAPLRTVQLFLDLADTDFTFHPRWPALAGLDALLLVDDTDISVWADTARIYDTQVQQLSAEAWMGPSGGMMLAVAGSLQGPAADGLAVLNDSPLREFVGDTFAAWQLTGDIHTRLQLLLDLGQKAAPPQVEVYTRWHDVAMQIEPAGLPLNAVNGEFDYHWRRGFSSRDLRAELWGEPLTAEVGGRPEPGGATPGLQPVRVALATRVDMADLQGWLGQELLMLARGSSEVDLELLFAPGEVARLTATSDLEGVSLDLPPPWHTTAEQARPLHLEMPLGGPGVRLDLALDGGVALALALDRGALEAGALAFNEAPAPLESGVFRVTGHTPLLDGDGWNRFVERYLSADLSGTAVPADDTDITQPGEVDDRSPADAPEALPSLRVDNLRADRLVILEREIRDIAVSLERTDGRWRAAAQTDWLQGQLQQAPPGSPSTLELGLLDLDGVQQLDLSVEPQGEALELPDVDVTISRLVRGGRALGRLAFELRSEGAEMRADRITGEFVGLRLETGAPGRLSWRQGEPAQTALDLSLAFDDFGETLEGLGYERILETKEGELDLHLQWPGGPQDYSLQTASGSLRVNMGRGSFPEAPAGASGALKVVGILNLANIVQRLSLSHMFESGIPFDTVKGDIVLHPGTIEVTQLDVRGAASRFQFSGVSDVATRAIEGRMVATLPVANNLPWVAALAGGLPVAAGVFVVSKLFEKQFDLLSSALYSIGGTWDDPQLKFDRIWGDGSARSEAGELPAEPASQPAQPQQSGDAGKARSPADQPAAPGSQEAAALPQP